MKAILVTFLFLQLVILNEGLRLARPTRSRYCPPSKELLALKKALGLTTGNVHSIRVTKEFLSSKTGHSRQKRGIGYFPFTCWHAAVVELNDGSTNIHPGIYNCCRECHFPKFLRCTRTGNPYWLCVGRAHQCICDCRERHTKTTHTKGARWRGKIVSRGKSRFSTSVCRKTTCDKYRRGQCCLDNKCIKLYIHKTKSPLKP